MPKPTIRDLLDEIATNSNEVREASDELRLQAWNLDKAVERVASAVGVDCYEKDYDDPYEHRIAIKKGKKRLEKDGTEKALRWGIFRLPYLPIGSTELKDQVPEVNLADLPRSELILVLERIRPLLAHWGEEVRKAKNMIEHARDLAQLLAKEMKGGDA